jgi:hypothetical protein
VSVALIKDGRLDVCTVASDGALWHIWQVTPGGAWSNWTSLGKPPATNLGGPAVMGINADGRLEAFTFGLSQNAQNSLWHIWQISPGGSWSNWQWRSFPPTKIGVANFFFKHRVAAERNADGRLEVFFLGSDGALWHTWQEVAGGAWG